MAEILPRDILLRAGGACLERYGVPFLRKDTPARGGEEGKETFTRADASTCARYRDRDGYLRLAAAGKLRPHWVDVDGDGVMETLTFLLESERTNELLRSQEFNDGSWTKTRSTITANPATAPDGTATGDLLAEDATAANSHFCAKTITIVAGAAVSHSVFARATLAANRHLFLQAGDAPNVFSAKFDLTTGVATSVGNGGTAVRTLMKIELDKSGWWRCSIAGTVDPAATSATCLIALTSGGITNYDGDGASGVYLWQAQAEEAPYPTSGIATTSAAVTRKADALTVPIGFGPQDITAYIKLARPVWADSSATFATGRVLLAVGGGTAPDWRLYGNPLAREWVSRVQDAVPAVGDAVASIPAGATLRLCAQVRNWATGASTRLNVGSGFGSWSSAIAAVTGFGAPTLALGSIAAAGHEADAAIEEALFVRGLRELEEMEAVPW